jgi:Flp pilus assembly protein TadD/uncharacterized caspase-like protein
LYVVAPVIGQESNRGAITTLNTTDTVRQNFALVVGISSYPNINRLLYADDDAWLFTDYLVNQKICEKKNVTLLIDSVATKANFFKELRKLLDKTGANDRVFIYFAGHGDVENDIESGFLLTYNCEPNNYPATDAIDISMLEKFVAAFTKKNTKVVLITDACRSGNLAGGMTGASSTITSLSKGFQNVIKILSCQPNQLSQEKNYPGGGHGVFTYHLIDGLSGLADRDNDQNISLRELDRYLDEVGTETAQQQVPKTEGDPQAKIAVFSEELKVALLAKKDSRNALAVNKKRSLTDTAWQLNPFFQAFNQQIRKQQLIEPVQHNAYETITAARKAGQPTGLLEEMKWELAAVLEDEAQKFINTYLRGTLPTDQQLVLKQIAQARDYLVTIQQMIGENDFRYNELLVKKLFFDAYYIFKQKNKKQFREALDLLETANRLSGNQAWICNAMGLFYEDLQQPGEAEKSYQKAAALAPHWSYPWNNLGMLYWNQLNYPQAEAAYKKSLLLDSTYGYAWNGLGNVLDDLERYTEATEAYRNAIRFNPDDPDPWNGLGNVYGDLRRYTEAENAYRAALSLDSLYAYPWNGLGINFENTGKIKDAELAYRKSMALDSGFVSPISNLASLLDDQEKYAEAIELYLKAVNLTPDNSSLWNGLGTVYFALKEYDKAESAYRESIRLDSTLVYPLYNLGKLYSRTNRFSEAVTCYEKAVQLKPAVRVYWDNLLEMLEYAERQGEKLAWYKKMITHFPGDQTISTKMGFIYLADKDYLNAEIYFLQALKLYPENTMLNYDLMSLYAVWDKKELALRYLEAAFKNGFDNFALLEKDPDLTSIRDTPGFRSIVNQYKK